MEEGGRRVLHWLREFLGRIKEATFGNSSWHTESKELEKSFAKMQKMWTEGLIDTTKTADSTGWRYDSSVMYDEEDGLFSLRSQEGGKASVKALDDGTQYVKLDGDLFHNSDGTEKTPSEAYNSLIGVSINMPDGDTISFAKRIGDIRLYKELFTKRPGYNKNDISDIKTVTDMINRNIYEVIFASQAKDRNVHPKHEHKGIVSYDERIVYIADDNTAYELVIDIANTTDGKKIAYAKKNLEVDKNLLDKIKMAEGRGTSPFDQPSDIKTQNDSAVNTQIKGKGSIKEQTDRLDEATVNKAIEVFGTTNDFAEAGFILPDGRLLRMTDDEHSGERNYDHRAIAAAYGESVDFGNNHGFYSDGKYLDRFVDGGAIRMEVGDPDLDLDAGLQLSAKIKPTAAQMQTIREFLEWKQEREGSFKGDETSLFNGALALGIDFGADSDVAAGYSNNPGGQRYIGEFSADKILNDIRHYYQTGEARAQSAVSQFHGKYSLKGMPTPTYNELISKGPITVVDIASGIKTGSYADMKADAIAIANENGWFDAPHPNDDTESLIFITPKSFTHAFSNLKAGFGEDTIRCMAHIPEIIKNAVLVNVANPKNVLRSENNVYTFFGAVYGANGMEPIKLTVKEYDFTSLNRAPQNIKGFFEKNGTTPSYNTLYDAQALEVIDIEKIQKELDASGEGREQNPLARATSNSKVSIADLLDIVNGEARKYIPKNFGKASQKDFNGDTLSTQLPEQKINPQNDKISPIEDGRSSRRDADLFQDPADLRLYANLLEDAGNALDRENRALRKSLEYWKKQTKRTKEKTISSKDMNALANRLRKDIGSDADKDSIVRMLTELGNYIVRTEKDKLHFNDIKQRARLIASMLVDHTPGGKPSRFEATECCYMNIGTTYSDKGFMITNLLNVDKATMLCV